MINRKNFNIIKKFLREKNIKEPKILPDFSHY